MAERLCFPGSLALMTIAVHDLSSAVLKPKEENLEWRSRMLGSLEYGPTVLKSMPMQVYKATGM